MKNVIRFLFVYMLLFSFLNNIHALEIPTAKDTTLRIAYWYGKVNQHIDISGNWVSDVDGTSGANLDKLTYCKKWYPNTISVKPYQTETITTWKRAIYFEQSDYTNSVVSDECVQGLIEPNTYINLLSPKVSDVFYPGQNVNISWSTNASPNTYVYINVFNSKMNLIKEIRTLNDNQETIKIPLGTPEGQYRIYYQIVYGPNSSGYHMADFITVNVVSPSTESTVDLKINGSDNPPPIQYKSKMVASWTTTGMTNCIASGHWIPVWPGNYQVWNKELSSVNGSIDLMAAFARDGNINQIQYLNQLKINLQCWNNNRQIDDTVYVNIVQKPSIGPICTDNTNVPKLTLITPNGNEKYYIGQRVKIKWSACNMPNGSFVRLLLFRNLPNNYQDTYLILESTASYDINTGYYDWVIPNDLKPADNYLLSVVCGNPDKSSNCSKGTGDFVTAVTDDSDKTFSILKEANTDAIEYPDDCKSISFTKTLKVGSRSNQVEALQIVLNDKDYLDDSLVTGYFGSKTRSALKAFQKDIGVLVTGYTGSTTRVKLNEFWNTQCLNEFNTQ